MALFRTAHVYISGAETTLEYYVMSRIRVANQSCHLFSQWKNQAKLMNQLRFRSVHHCEYRIHYEMSMLQHSACNQVRNFDKNAIGFKIQEIMLAGQHACFCIFMRSEVLHRIWHLHWPYCRHNTGYYICFNFVSTEHCPSRIKMIHWAFWETTIKCGRI